jgi:hypothetical protein
METHDFSPKVHVLASMLVPVVSTNTWWFSGQEMLHEPRPHIEHHTNLPTSEVTQ